MNADDAADGLGHGLHHVQPDAAAGDVRDLLGRREAGQEQEIEQLRIAEPGGQIARGQPLGDDLGSECGQVDAAAVLGHADVEHAGLMSCFQLQRTGLRLARGRAFLGHLQAVVQCVAEQVAQRRFELVQNVAVHVGRLAEDFKPDLLAESAGDVAHHPLHAVRAVRERSHAAGDNLAVQPSIQIVGLPGMRLEFLDADDKIAAALRQLRQRFFGGPQQSVRPSVRHGQVAVQLFERIRHAVLLLLQSQQGLRERLQPMGFDQRFPGQSEQPRQALGTDADDPILFPRRCGFGDRLGRFRGRRLRLDSGKRHRLRQGSARQGRFEIRHRHTRAVLVRRGPNLQVRAAQFREQIDGVKQGIDVLGRQPVFAVLGRDQQFFHHMRQIDAGIDADDAGRPLDAVGGPHQRLDPLRVGGILFQLHQTVRERSAKRSDLLPEQLHQRDRVRIQLRLRLQLRLRCDHG